MSKAPAKAKRLFCARESFMDGGETLEQILANAAKALMLQVFDASVDGNAGAVHGG